jgi:hypothetical protein
MLASALALDWSSDGWYSYYAFDLPRQHRIVARLWLDFWKVDLMAPLACACLGALFVIAGPSGLAREVRALWGAALIGVLLASWSSRLHDGGWTNVLMPTYAVLSALFAIAMQRVCTLAAQLRSPARNQTVMFAQLVAAIQLALLLFDPRKVVPSEQDEAAGWKIVSALRAARGDVFVPTHSYLSVMAGKRPHLHEMAMRDLERARPSAVTSALTGEVERALRERRWAVVVTDNDFFPRAIAANYVRVGPMIEEPLAFYPVSGARTRPSWLFVPK